MNSPEKKTKSQRIAELERKIEELQVVVSRGGAE